MFKMSRKTREEALSSHETIYQKITFEPLEMGDCRKSHFCNGVQYFVKSQCT